MHLSIQRIAKIFALMGLLSLSSLAMAWADLHVAQLTVAYHGTSAAKTGEKTFELSQCINLHGKPYKGQRIGDYCRSTMIHLAVDPSAMQYDVLHKPIYRYQKNSMWLALGGVAMDTYIMIGEIDHLRLYYRTDSPFCLSGEHVDIDFNSITSSTCDGHYVLWWPVFHE